MANLDLYSWLTGFCLGLADKPLPFMKKTPIGYSYNGTVLPKLPEWDKTVYPYAAIYATKGFSITGDAPNYYFLLLSGAKMVYTEEYNQNNLYWYGIHTENKVETQWCRYECIDNVWTVDKEQTVSAFNLNASAGTVWGNHDIYYANYYPDETLAGTVCTAASEPVPVYE